MKYLTRWKKYNAHKNVSNYPDCRECMKLKAVLLRWRVHLYKSFSFLPFVLAIDFYTAFTVTWEIWPIFVCLMEMILYMLVLVWPWIEHRIIQFCEWQNCETSSCTLTLWNHYVKGHPKLWPLTFFASKVKCHFKLDRL